MKMDGKEENFKAIFFYSFSSFWGIWTLAQVIVIENIKFIDPWTVITI